MHPLKPCLEEGASHLDEGLGQARALSVITLRINSLLLDLSALIVHMVTMVVLVTISNFQFGPAQKPDAAFGLPYAAFGLDLIVAGQAASLPMPSLSH